MVIENLNQLRVGIAGLGGLGSNVAWMLVRTGVSQLVLADYDPIQAVNLNRQYYFPYQVGQSKVGSLAVNLGMIQPKLELTLIETRLTPENFLSFFDSCDLVVEAFDTPLEKKWLLELCLQKMIPVIGASGIGGYGQSDQIRLRKLGGQCWIVGDEITPCDSTHPAMAPRVLCAAAKQADLVLSWFANEWKPKPMVLGAQP